MKTKILILLIAFIGAGILSCDDEKQIVDPVYEFVAFAGNESVDINELTNSSEGHPVVIQLYIFEPFREDVTVDLSVTGTNAQSGIDFTVTPGNTVTIKAGKFVSDTIWIKTIDNPNANELARSVEVEITGISKSDLKLGLGIANPRNASVVFNILDDECSGNPICIFNADLMNTIGGSSVNPATGTVDKLNSKVTVVGDLIGYAPFPEAMLTMTLTPGAPGSATGTVTFDEQETGTDSDGYKYKFIQVGEGTYNATTGTLSIEYDIYYQDGGWVHWYTVTNEFEVP